MFKVGNKPGLLFLINKKERTKKGEVSLPCPQTPSIFFQSYYGIAENKMK